MVSTRPAISAGVSPLARSATANAAICAGVAAAGHDLAHRPRGVLCGQLVAGQQSRRQLGQVRSLMQPAGQRPDGAGSGARALAQQARRRPAPVVDRVQRVGQDGVDLRVGGQPAVRGPGDDHAIGGQSSSSSCSCRAMPMPPVGVASPSSTTRSMSSVSTRRQAARRRSPPRRTRPPGPRPAGCRWPAASGRAPSGRRCRAGRCTSSVRLPRRCPADRTGRPGTPSHLSRVGSQDSRLGPYDAPSRDLRHLRDPPPQRGEIAHRQ